MKGGNKLCVRVPIKHVHPRWWKACHLGKKGFQGPWRHTRLSPFHPPDPHPSEGKSFCAHLRKALSFLSITAQATSPHLWATARVPRVIPGYHSIYQLLILCFIRYGNLISTKGQRAEVEERVGVGVESFFSSKY